MSTLDAGSTTQAARGMLWRNRNFRWLLITSNVSLIGSQFSSVAIPWVALKVTGSSTVLAATVASMAIPQVTFILLGGAAADRYSARNILTITNCANAAALAGLAIATASGTLQTHTLLILTFLVGTSAAFAVPAASTLLPRIVAPELFAPANSLFMMSRHIAALIGPVAAGSLIAWISSATSAMRSVPFPEAAGISVALAIDAFTFLVTAWSIRLINVSAPVHSASRSVLRSLIEGWEWLWNDRPLRTLLTYYAAIMLLVMGPSQIGIPVLIDTQLGYGAAGLGALLTATSLGSIGGIAVAGMNSSRRLAPLGKAILALDILGGASLIALSHTYSMLIAMLLCALVGIGAGYVQIGVITWIQQRLPLDMMGRAMSVIMLVPLAAVPLSAAITGALLTRLTISTILTACGSLLVLIASLCLSNSTLRSIDQQPASSPPPRR